jgi:hypothetical protein
MSVGREPSIIYFSVTTCHQHDVGRLLLCSSGPLTASPPGEKAAARQDQAGQASTQRGLSFGEEAPQKAGSRQRNMLWIISLFIAATKTCPIRSTMFRFRVVASRASTAIAGEESGISEVFSLPWHRIVIAT